MTTLLIALAMALIFWLGYTRGHRAGKAEVRWEHFERTRLCGLPKNWRPGFIFFEENNEHE